MCQLIKEAGQSNYSNVLASGNSDDLSAADMRGSNLYHYAATHGNIEVAAHLKKNAVHLDIDAMDETGWTPLHYALFHEQVSMALWLYENGALLQPTKGITPRQLAELTKMGIEHPLLCAGEVMIPAKANNHGGSSSI